MGQAAKAFSSANKSGARRLLRRVLTAALLASALGAPMAEAQPVNNVPSSVRGLSAGFNPAALPAIPPDIAGYINDPADAPEITALKTEFAKTEMGIGLLRFAQNHHIHFVLDDTLGARHSKAEYDPSNGNILIRPGQKLGGLVIYTAHEIRHGWQDKVLGAMRLEQGVMTPWQRWTLRRYLEADAEAFSAYFEADRLRNGLPTLPGFAEAMPASTISMQLRGEFWSRNGLTFGEYRQLAFEPSLAALHTYNARQLAFVEDMTLDFGKRVLAADGDKVKLAALERQVQAAPDDAAFEAFLRHLGGVSFNTEAQTSTQSRAVTREMLFNDYPRREASPLARENFPPVLDKKIADLTALQDAYIRVLHNSSGKKPAPKPGS